MALYPRLIRYRHQLLRLESTWQHILGLALPIAFGVSFFGIVDLKPHAEVVVTLGAPALWLLNLALYFVLRIQRKEQITFREIAHSIRAFSSTEKFSEIFDGAVRFSHGRIDILRPVVPFSFIRRANEADMEQINRINLEAFARSPWSDNADRKSKRNNSIYQKNNFSFFVIDKFNLKSGRLDRQDGAVKPIFFSCFLPLSETGFQRYFIDKVGGDNEFRADWVATPSEPVRCLLMFSIARDLAAVKEMGGSTNPDLLGFYLRCCGVHLEQIMRAQGLIDCDITVYFQNSDPTFARLASLAGMQKTGLTSADAEVVYVTTVRIAGA